MSKFGDLFVAARNALEAKIESLWVEAQPELQEALVTSVKAGVAAALAKHAANPDATPGDLWVAARDATTQILQAKGQSIGQALIEHAVTEQLTPSVPAVTP